MGSDDQTGTTPDTSPDDLQGERDKRPVDRRCQGTKDDGTACGAWTVLGETYCAGHLGLGVGAGGDVARAAQRQGASRRSELAQERRKRTQDVLVDMVEELQTEMREAYAAAIRGDDGALDRVRAAEMLLSRVWGKPKETTVVEVELPEDFQALRQMSVRDLAQLYRQLDGDGALAQLLPADEELAQVVAVQDEPLLDG